MKCEIKSVGLKLNLKRTLNEEDVSKFPWRRCCSQWQLPQAVEKRQTAVAQETALLSNSLVY